MTCHPTFTAATVAMPTTPNADRSQYEALGRAMDSKAKPAGPAQSTSPSLMSGIAERIASRCKRMTFRSNEARKRYLTVHRLFASKTCSGDT